MDGKRSGILAMGMVAVAVLAGCANVVHQSQLGGALYTRVHMNRFPVAIAAVDGASTPTWQPIWIEPGRRALTLDAPPPRGFTLPVRKEVMLDVKPCVRYYLGAQRANALAQAWEFVVDHEEPVPGCTTSAKKSALASSVVSAL